MDGTIIVALLLDMLFAGIALYNIHKIYMIKEDAGVLTHTFGIPFLVMSIFLFTLDVITLVNQVEF